MDKLLRSAVVKAMKSVPTDCTKREKAWRDLADAAIVAVNSHKHTDHLGGITDMVKGHPTMEPAWEQRTQNTVSTPMNGTWKYSPTLEKEVFVPDEPTKPSEDK